MIDLRAGGHLDPEAPQIGRLDRLAVEGDVELRVRRVRAGEAESRSGGDPELVFGVEREVVREAHATAGAQRQPLDVLALREPGGATYRTIAGCMERSPTAPRLIFSAADT